VEGGVGGARLRPSRTRGCINVSAAAERHDAHDGGRRLVSIRVKSESSWEALFADTPRPEELRTPKTMRRPAGMSKVR
jgi:hypothetical protein